MSDDPIMREIQAAILTLQGGARTEARQAFTHIWAKIARDPKPLQECTLAHFMADAQDNLQDELAWDQRALAAAMRCTDADAKGHHDSLSIAAFMPSLHLNLGDDNLRLGDKAACRRHLEAGAAATADLPDTPYASMIRAGLDGLAERLRSTPSLVDF
jgi:hypothetical protein